MEQIYEQCKVLCIFVVLWKMILNLCARKSYEKYGRTLLGMVVLLQIAGGIINWKNNWNETEILDNLKLIENKWENNSELYTKTKEIKTKLDNVNVYEEKCSQPQENRGFDKTKKSEQKDGKVSINETQRDISTINVENILPILIKD